MDAKTIRGLQPMLARFLKRFDDCFARKDTRAHLAVYVNGQLSDLPRKSVEPIALAAGVPVRTLQEFLSQHRWLEDLARDRLQQIVAEEHACRHSVGVIDETSFVKQGKKTPGVQRQEDVLNAFRHQRIKHPVIRQQSLIDRKACSTPFGING